MSQAAIIPEVFSLGTFILHFQCPAMMAPAKYINNSRTIKEVFYVAKKKRRYNNRTKHEYHPPKTPYDKHHLCFIGRKWSNGWLQVFRQYWYCVIYIPRDTLHREIHENLATIPAPKPENAREALEQLRILERYGAIHEGDDIETRLQILIMLFDYIEPRTVDGFRKQLEIVREYRHSE